MTNRKNTKRALIASVISVLLCVTMLMGSTFAWFTDNASTAVNSIQSGLLDIVLLDESGNNLEGATLSFTDKDQNKYWEPGCTYALPTVYIQNNGNLAVKYTVEITGINGDAELNKVIDWTVTDGTDAADKTGHLLPGEKKAITISGTMQTTAGNEYQNKTISGIGITVRATQDTVEFDSTTDQYDASATYDQVVNVANQAALNSAVANANGPVTLILKDGAYTLPNLSGKEVTISGTKNVVINYSANVGANNANITFDGVTIVYPNNGTYIGLQHTAHVVYRDCEIKGTQFLYAPDVSFDGCTFTNLTNAYCVWTYGATSVNFTNCTFNTSGKAILVYTESETHATIDLDNCVFNDDDGANVMKAAVEVGSNPYSADTTYEIYIDNCTVNGFAVTDEGLSTGSKLWGNKNSMDKDHLNVIIDGIEVY